MGQTNSEILADSDTGLGVLCCIFLLVPGKLLPAVLNARQDFQVEIIFGRDYGTGVEVAVRTIRIEGLVKIKDESSGLFGERKFNVSPR